MNHKITQELLEKARSAKSAQELLAIARENHIEMNEEDAAAYFDKLNRSVGELSDEELDNVAGGGCGEPEWTKLRYSVGDTVVLDYPCGGSCGCTTAVIFAARRVSKDDHQYLMNCTVCGEVRVAHERRSSDWMYEKTPIIGRLG